MFVCRFIERYFQIAILLNNNLRNNEQNEETWSDPRVCDPGEWFFKSNIELLHFQSMDSYSRDSSLADSVLSPHSVSRLEEKDSLIHLNDRLANYINRVRQLEKENRHLDVKIKETEVCSFINQ